MIARFQCLRISPEYSAAQNNILSLIMKLFHSFWSRLLPKANNPRDDRNQVKNLIFSD